ncbi:MAG: tetratricopeptide repeat protein [Nitrospira sp.]|nr:tetratricopeptide repeat protein [Nitrospira sp.]
MDKKIAEIRNLIDSGKLEEAEIALSDALKQYPDSQELLHLQAGLKLKMGDIFWENSDIDKALESYTEALEINPNDRNIVLKCGEVLSSLEQHVTAKRLYSSYLQKYPEDNEIVQAQKNWKNPLY